MKKPAISVSDPKKMESWFQRYFEEIKPRVEDRIESCEKSSLAIIKDHGYEIRKPYNYFDRYVVDGDRHTYIDCKQYNTAEKLAKATNYNPVCVLTKAIERIEDDPIWTKKAIGIATKILDHCQQLRSSMLGDKKENTAHNAMLLQQEVDHLKFIPWAEVAKEGQRVIEGRSYGGGKTAVLRKQKVKGRNQQILEIARSGTKTKDIADRFSLTQRQIQNILKESKK